MTLRLPAAAWRSFVTALCARGDVETAGVILAERLGDGDVLLARHLVPFPEDGYLVRQSDRVRLDPVAINRLVRRARDDGLSVLTVHTHPGASSPWFSVADDQGDSRLIPSLFAQMPGPHGSVVIAGASGTATGRVWAGPGDPQPIGLRIVGQALEVHPARRRSDEEAGWFARQRLALGSQGQAALRDVHVAVIGLGGTGSVAFAQLAHLGVGRITAVDGDRVEPSNVSRILGARVDDAGFSWKVDVAARYASQLGLGTQVKAVRGHLGPEGPAGVIETCDVILSCVDRHTPRAILNRLAYEKAIPLIDVGTAFRVDCSGRVVAGVGRLVVVGPTRRCLACWGHIDPDRLRIEALSHSERTRAVAEGYIEGAEVAQPSVIPFNTMVAGAAIVELLRLVTQFAGDDDPPARLSFDFSSGGVRRNCLAVDIECSICGGGVPRSDEDAPQ